MLMTILKIDSFKIRFFVCSGHLSLFSVFFLDQSYMSNNQMARRFLMGIFKIEIEAGI